MCDCAYRTVKPLTALCVTVFTGQWNLWRHYVWLCLQDSEAWDGTVCNCVYNRTVKPVTALCLQDSEACDGTVRDCVYNRPVKPVMVLCVTVFTGQWSLWWHCVWLCLQDSEACDGIVFTGQWSLWQNCVWLCLQDGEACDSTVCDCLQDGEACDGNVCVTLFTVQLGGEPVGLPVIRHSARGHQSDGVRHALHQARHSRPTHQQRWPSGEWTDHWGRYREQLFYLSTCLQHNCLKENSRCMLAWRYIILLFPSLFKVFSHKWS